MTDSLLLSWVSKPETKGKGTYEQRAFGTMAISRLWYYGCFKTLVISTRVNMVSNWLKNNSMKTETDGNMNRVLLGE